MRKLLISMVVVVVCLAESVGTETARGTPPAPEEIKEQIKELLTNPPFGTKETTYKYKFRWESGEEQALEEHEESLGLSLSWLGDLVGWFGDIAEGMVWSLEVILWILVIALAFLILLNFKRLLPYFRRQRVSPAPTLPGALFGKDTTAEVLPDDIATKAWERWQQGDARGCLSLLYRGALLRIILSRRIQLPDSATEEDCLREVLPVESPERAGYFQRLTSRWKSTAYAARHPERSEVEALMQGWREHFGESA